RTLRCHSPIRKDREAAADRIRSLRYHAPVFRGRIFEHRWVFQVRTIDRTGRQYRCSKQEKEKHTFHAWAPWIAATLSEGGGRDKSCTGGMTGSFIRAAKGRGLSAC